MDVKEEAMVAFEQFDVRKQRETPQGADLPQASVLVPLFVKNGKIHTLMTKRSDQLRTSAGEVCFPGGKRDPSDEDDVQTALREAQEEIGLPPGDVHVICTLQPVISKNGLLVTPVVGFIPESFQARPNPAEVSAVFAAPLELFVGPFVAGETASWVSFDFVEPDTGVKYRIWGLTAMVALVVAAIALKTKDDGFNVEDLMLRLRQRMRARSKL
ncbi:peroxisomal coenzyme A diphosphatase NUDT7 isoform X1 [Corythoichthys intestinalis]|uniref:peroxisomal coenzyme A diphosphatase NUDT7 isoform X1 n=1 Tax=Corythoichthys intestinalis TaxID=161448 RepID=UPI0025A5446B|nr:peroxisomal coenzyme A diphosphatase NUDT7 isoform X1 [Corythoichthys intestinalis]XP_061812469.1 peroxisomal coenzyme A diphosphatase NUDT7-like [Nerophis lumbriciformis]